MARRLGEAWRGEAWRSVAWRGVEGVKGLESGSARPLPGGPNGLALLKVVHLPSTLDRLPRDNLGILIPIFLPSRCLFFASFFHAFLDRFWVDFDSQLGSKNPPTSLKNRCQDASHHGLKLFMHFGSAFAPNFDPLDLKKTCFPFDFLVKSRFEVNINF